MLETPDAIKARYAEVRARLRGTPITPKITLPPKTPPKPTTPQPDPLDAAIARNRELLKGASDFLSKRRCLLILPILEAHNVTWAQIVSPSRKHHIIACRHEIMAELRDDGLSLTQIGAAVGGKDHTTVLHGIRKFKGDDWASGHRLAADTDHAGDAA